MRQLHKLLLLALFPLAPAATAESIPSPAYYRVSLASRGAAPQADYMGMLRKATLKLHRKGEAELARWSAVPTQWPCQGELSSPFGGRSHPVMGGYRLHPGVDVCADVGTPIHATAAGRVIFADWLPGYGYTVEIKHAPNLTTFYAHCSKLEAKRGAYVQKNEIVARVGCTGMATGPHCHYEIHLNGQKIDPAPYMKRHSL